ncbi:MAG: twin-arginine translocation signal domain-containing protein [Candidatus Rokuibacteriota bacterium]
MLPRTTMTRRDLLRAGAVLGGTLLVGAPLGRSARSAGQGQPVQFFRVKAGQKHNRIVLRVRNEDSFFQVGFTEVSVLSRPAFVVKTSVEPPMVFPQLLHPGDAGEVTVRFDVSKHAPVGQTGHIVALLASEDGQAVQVPVPIQVVDTKPIRESTLLVPMRGTQVVVTASPERLPDQVLLGGVHQPIPSVSDVQFTILARSDGSASLKELAVWTDSLQTPAGETGLLRFSLAGAQQHGQIDPSTGELMISFQAEVLYPLQTSFVSVFDQDGPDVLLTPPETYDGTLHGRLTFDPGGSMYFFEGQISLTVARSFTGLFEAFFKPLPQDKLNTSKECEDPKCAKEGKKSVCLRKICVQPILIVDDNGKNPNSWTDKEIKEQLDTLKDDLKRCCIDVELKDLCEIRSTDLNNFDYPAKDITQDFRNLKDTKPKGKTGKDCEIPADCIRVYFVRQLRNPDDQKMVEAGGAFTNPEIGGSVISHDTFDEKVCKKGAVKHQTAHEVSHALGLRERRGLAHQDADNKGNRIMGCCDKSDRSKGYTEAQCEAMREKAKEVKPKQACCLNPGS